MAPASLDVALDFLALGLYLTYLGATLLGLDAKIVQRWPIAAASVAFDSTGRPFPCIFQSIPRLSDASTSTPSPESIFSLQSRALEHAPTS